MGASVSKAKQFQFKPLSSIRFEEPHHKVTDYHHQQKGSMNNGPNNNIMKKKKKKNQRKKNYYYQVGNVSVNKSKPKYKKVTKSIIGKPTNFKHTRHMGVDDIISGQTDMMTLSNQLNDITSHINSIDYPLKLSTPSPLHPPPPPPPHKYISASVKKRAQAYHSSSQVPASFRRRHQRKAVSRHHPNLKLVNTLMIEVPSFRSITT
ncbi:hypothetical protein BJ944DRAFT_268364 [Cunninghamella echinulata]|nr:hypothetical protein BJ944DRAFT_268364 [Cunninghamella echinulata]